MGSDSRPWKFTIHHNHCLGVVKPGRAIVVHREKVILDADEAAESRGIQIGMALSEAKAILPEARFEVYREEDYLDERNHWLDVIAGDQLCF